MKLLIIILFTITGVYAQFTQFPTAPAPAPAGGTIISAKGGILSSNGSADVELSVGADGQVLIADSGETSGLRWGAAGGGSGSDLPVGSVVHSMLTEAQFQAIKGSGWVLMDGRDVTGSSYAGLVGNNTLPDARGLFLRAKNNLRLDGKQNPDGDLVLGTFTADKTAPNGLATASDGAHQHYLGDVKGNFWDQAANYTNALNADGTPLNDIEPDSYSASAGAHTHSITGDNETAPNALTVNIFIRIN